jgi:hypothetical protein
VVQGGRLTVVGIAGGPTECSFFSTPFESTVTNTKIPELASSSVRRPGMVFAGDVIAQPQAHTAALMGRRLIDTAQPPCE